MNSLIDFLIQRHEPCRNYGCSTCGGIFRFLQELEAQVTGSWRSQLLKMDNSSARKIQGKWNAIRQILDRLSVTERHEVLERWIENSLESLEFAKLVFHSTDYGSALSDHQFYKLMNNASEELYIKRYVRNDLRRIAATKNVEVPVALADAFARDDESDFEEAKEKARKIKERECYFDSLARLPFNDRVRAICADKSISMRSWQEWQPWSSIWSHCNDDDLSALSASDIQELIDLDEICFAFRSWDTQRKLYDRRHFLRLREIDAIRIQFANVNLQDQLDQLVHDDRVPIEHFPQELTELVTREWFFALEPKVKQRFRTMLEACRLKIWKRVLNSLNERP